MSACVTAVVLAGGLGTRLRGVVSDRPKVLADVAGRPFLERILEQISATGIQNVVLSVGYLADQVEKTYGTSFENLSINYAREQTLLGTGGAIRLASTFSMDDTLLVLNGDSYCSFDYKKFSSFHQEHPERPTLLVTTVDSSERFGSVSVSPQGKVLDFVEKGFRVGPGLINAGVYLLPRSLVLTIDEGKSISLEKEVFPTWIEGGLYALETEAKNFIDIGTPESYRQAQVLFQR